MNRSRSLLLNSFLAVLTLLLIATTASAQKVGQKPECSAGMGGTACGEPDHATGIDSGNPSPDKARSAGNDSPGLGAGIMDLPYTNAEENAELRSRISRRLADCADWSKSYVDAARWHHQRTSHPELNASSCIRLEKNPSLYGGFENTCDFRVEFRFCAYHPKKDAWNESFDCEKTQGGTELIDAKEHLQAHTKNAEWIYWAGCRYPKGTPSDFQFHPGKGYDFRCLAWDEVEDGPAPGGEIAGCTAMDVENEERATMAAENKQRLETEARAKRERELVARQRQQAERERLEEERLAREEVAAALRQQRGAEAAEARRQANTTYPQRAPVETPRPQGNYCEPQLQALYNAYLTAPQPAEEQLLRSGRQGQEQFFRLIFINNQNELTGYTMEKFGTRPDINNPEHLRKFAEFGAKWDRYPPLAWGVCYARARASEIERGGR